MNKEDTVQCTEELARRWKTVRRMREIIFQQYLKLGLSADGPGRWTGPMAAMGVEKQTINLEERNYEHYNVIC